MIKLGSQEVTKVAKGAEEVSAVYRGTDEVWSAGGGGGGRPIENISEAFSTYLYTGDGTQYRTIENGIDLAGEGGLVWIKNRDVSNSHFLQDTERGPAQTLSSDTTDASAAAEYLSAFETNGFTTSRFLGVNQSDENLVSWTFRKGPKFFDCITYTGNGTQNRGIPHNLGCRPGLVIVKSIDQRRAWYVWHNSFPEYTGGTTEGSIDGGNVTGHLLLNTGDAYQTRGYFTYVNDDAFGVNYNRSDLNGDGEQYVAYLFAHDDSDESVIKCGTYRGNGAADGPEIDLGFEPQWVMIKCATTGSSGWNMYDTMRGLTAEGKPTARLVANTAAAEYYDDNYTEIAITPTGFRMTGTNYQTNGGGLEYIYMAIKSDPNFFMPPEWEQMNQEVAENSAEREAKKEAVKEAIVSKVKDSKDIKDDS